MVRDALIGIGFTDDNKKIEKLYEDTLSYSIQMRSLSGSRKIKIFIQGSYANNTNVRTHSDVDIAVVQEETFFTAYRPGITKKDYGFVDAEKPIKTFKDEVQEALEKKFGNDVERKNKSIKVNGNTYRKDADSVPCKRYRNYLNDFKNDPNDYVGGIYINADDGSIIINYPEQHIENGRQKNTDTDHYYKKMVRIIKKMRYLMEDNNIISAKNVSSFGLESLLWNIPNNYFKKYYRYGFIFSDILKYLSSNSLLFGLFKEANGIKDLCPNQEDCKHFNDFILDLIKFYEYSV